MGKTEFPGITNSFIPNVPTSVGWKWITLIKRGDEGVYVSKTASQKKSWSKFWVLWASNKAFWYAGIRLIIPKLDKVSEIMLHAFLRNPDVGSWWNTHPFPLGWGDSVTYTWDLIAEIGIRRKWGNLKTAYWRDAEALGCEAVDSRYMAWRQRCKYIKLSSKWLSALSISRWCQASQLDQASSGVTSTPFIFAAWSRKADAIRDGMQEILFAISTLNLTHSLPWGDGHFVHRSIRNWNLSCQLVFFKAGK